MWPSRQTRARRAGGPMNRRTSQLNIFIAHGHEEVRRDIRTVLEQRRKWKIRGEAATGGDTIRLARTLRPDVLFLDIALPDMNAVEAIPEIMRACPTVRIVVLGMPGRGELAVKALAAGATGLVMKSDAGKDLLLAVQNIAKNRRFFSSTAERCVRDYAGKEMKRLIRERKNIDRAIADFERLQARSRAKGLKPAPVAGAKPEILVEMKRKLQGKR